MKRLKKNEQPVESPKQSIVDSMEPDHQELLRELREHPEEYGRKLGQGLCDSLNKYVMQEYEEDLRRAQRKAKRKS